MKENEIREKFEDLFIKGTCFDSFDDLMADNTSIQINAPRAMIAVNLKGAWHGFRKGIEIGEME